VNEETFNRELDKAIEHIRVAVNFRRILMERDGASPLHAKSVLQHALNAVRDKLDNDQIDNPVVQQK
jgi:hypothetical protein